MPAGSENPANCTNQVVHGAAPFGTGLQEIILGIPNQQALALEGAAHAPGQPLDE